MSEYGFGVVCGVVVGVVLIAVILRATKTDGPVKCKYDERQQLVRGRGFKYAFFTLMFYNVIYGMQEILFERSVMDDLTGMFLGIALGGVVYAVYCIWHDGYFSLNENPRRVQIAFLGIGVFNLALAFRSMMRGTMIEEGMLTLSGTNLFCGVMLLVVCGVSFAKQKRMKKETD